MIYDEIIKLAEDNKVQLGVSFKEGINKTLALGMTRYVCRYGALSDGHEKITAAQRYYQAIKEMWTIANSIESNKISAMESQADLIDAEVEFAHVESASNKLRAEAKVLRAKNKLTGHLVSIEDLTRQLDEFNKVRLELKNAVESKYPLGIEQAEEDNWKAVAQYRIARANMGYQEMLNHVPLNPIEKAKMGIMLKRPDMTYWAAIGNQELIESKYHGDFERFLKEETLKQLEKK